MPTYEYACKACGEHLEVVQSFKDDPLTQCPACQGPLRKVFGNIGIAFKGNGFYRTDSRSDTRSAPKTGAAKAAEGSSGTAEASTSSSAGTDKPSSAGTSTSSSAVAAAS